MKKIGFIGGYDKTDLIIYVAKILTELGQNVLVVDATINQKARYIIPVINPTLMYVTEYEDIDIAVGFKKVEDIKKYLTKVYFSKEMLKEEDDYLNFLSLGYKIIWNDYRVYFPIENGDLSVIHENQRVAKIKFKKLSVQYKDGLAYLTEEILGDANESRVRRAIKTIERGV